MFRIGGTAEGITSGLSRQGYQGTGQAWEQFVKKIPDIREQAKEAAYQPRGTNVYDFMTEFGLDIASRPPVPGGIIATAATSAKEPYQRFMQRKGEADVQRYASESDMFKTMLGSYGDIMAAKEEGAGKNWLEQWKFDQIPILNDIIRTLEPKRTKETITPDEEAKLEDAIDQKARIVKLGEVASAWLKTEDGGFAVVDMKDKLLREDAKLPENERKYKGKRDIQLTIDAIDAVTRALQAKGGRVGYQNAGAVMPGQPMQAQAPGPTDQGPAPEDTAGISYEELRARLPQEITDDIVRLLANSAEALEDFAMIQTEQDINTFNKKYGVTLVLPSEG